MRTYGERIEGYDIPVINEREARAAAGLLLLPAVSSFYISYLTHDFRFTQLFVTFFMIDFFIRVFIHPRYAPSMIAGRFFVRNQTPEYVGAAQKRFAWGIGFALAVAMFFIIVVLQIMTPIKIAICFLCVVLLFSETAFGICLGCIAYHKLLHRKVSHCPGGVCETREKDPAQRISPVQLIVLGVTVFTLFAAAFYIFDKNEDTAVMKCGAGKCQVGKCGGR
jgi:hypothetical protein